jgi:hypothetical protein
MRSELKTGGMNHNKKETNERLKESESIKLKNTWILMDLYLRGKIKIVNNVIVVLDYKRVET